MIGDGRDRPEKAAGKAQRSRVVEITRKQATQPEAFSGRPPKGRPLLRKAASRVGHDDSSSLPPCSYLRTKMRSVMTIADH